MFRECIFPVSRSEALVCGVGCSESFFPGCFGGPRTSQDVPRVSHVHSLRLLAFQQRLCARCRLIHSWRPVVGALATTTNRRSMRSLHPRLDRSDGRKERQDKRRSSTVDPTASWIDTHVVTGGGKAWTTPMECERSVGEVSKQIFQRIGGNFRRPYG